MKLETPLSLRFLDSLLARAVAFDLETHKTQPGLRAPPVVCGAVAWWDSEKRDAVGKLLYAEQALEVFVGLLKSDKIVVGANIAYDTICMMAMAEKRGLDIAPLVFKAHEEGRFFDVLLAEQLHAIAMGTLGKDPRTGGPLRDPRTGVADVWYNLDVVSDLVRGVKHAKVNDLWRTSYALLEHLAHEQWPREAREYPVDDVRHTLLNCLAQCGLIPRPSVAHDYGPDDRCTVCGGGLFAGGDCVPRAQRHWNLHDHAAQVCSDLCLNLGAAWGFATDQKAVDALEEDVKETNVEQEAPLLELGILKWKKEKGVRKVARDMRTIKTKIARAYGSATSCPTCSGIGGVVGPKTRHVRCMPCKGGGFIGGQRCVGCAGTGRQARQLAACTDCDKTGLFLEPPVPRTDGDGAKCKPCATTGKVDGEPCEACEGAGVTFGISTARDTLQESGDEELLNLGHYLEKQKIGSTYIPWLREGRDPFTHAPVPLTLRPYCLVATGRTSYGGVVQQLPRKGGVRECIVARPGMVLCSVDFESGELMTHAQSCRWIVGWSALLDALVSGAKVHNRLAANLLGLDYAEYQRRYEAKDQVAVDARTPAKWGNFGLPGRMGAVKFVMTCRKADIDTPCTEGSTWITTEDGKRVRGHRGLRLCVLMDGMQRCGERKISEWKGRHFSPVCERCVLCAERLKQTWLRTWGENRLYFEHVQRVEEEGQALTEEQKILFGVDKLKPGTLVQHVSNRVRGPQMGKDSVGNAIANSYFQGLLADATKSALRRACREMYADPSSPLYGSRFILFAHDELLAELPEHRAHEAAMRLSQIMVEELRRYCPDVAPAVAAEPAIAYHWSKGMAPRWRDGGKKPANDNDRLVPWDERELRAA